MGYPHPVHKFVGAAIDEYTMIDAGTALAFARPREAS
jgi:hypothetical protein